MPIAPVELVDGAGAEALLAPGALGELVDLMGVPMGGTSDAFAVADGRLNRDLETPPLGEAEPFKVGEVTLASSAVF